MVRRSWTVEDTVDTGGEEPSPTPRPELVVVDPGDVTEVGVAIEVGQLRYTCCQTTVQGKCALRTDSWVTGLCRAQ